MHIYEVLFAFHQTHSPWTVCLGLRADFVHDTQDQSKKGLVHRALSCVIFIKSNGIYIFQYVIQHLAMMTTKGCYIWLGPLRAIDMKKKLFQTKGTHWYHVNILDQIL